MHLLFARLQKFGMSKTKNKFYNIINGIRNKLSLLNRCKLYARRLDKIDHLLGEYWKKRHLSTDILNLMDEIERILDSK